VSLGEPREGGRSPPPTRVIVEVGVAMNAIPGGGLVVGATPAASFGTPTGGDLEGVVVVVQQALPIFADDFETGDVSAWSSSVGIVP
jgi:hypothetical protein